MAWHSAESLHHLGEQIIQAVIDTVSSDMQGQMDAIGDVKVAEESPPKTTARGAGGNWPTEAEIKEWAHTEFGYIPRLLGGFGNGGPELSAPARDAMWSIVGALDPSFKAQIHDQSGHLSSVMPTGSSRWRPNTGGDPNITVADRSGAITRRLEYWRGTAADSFNSNFVLKIPSKAEVQKSVAATLATCIEAEQRIRQTANDDVWRIGQATLKLIDAMGSPCQPSAQDVIGGLTIFGALVGVFTATGPLGMALAGVGLASSTQGVVTSNAPGKKTVNINGDSQPATISGGDVMEAISSMRNAIQRVMREIPGQEQDLRRVIQDVSLNVSDEEMTVPAPAGVTGVASHNVATISREGADNALQFSPTS